MWQAGFLGNLFYLFFFTKFFFTKLPRGNLATFSPLELIATWQDQGDLLDEASSGSQEVLNRGWTTEVAFEIAPRLEAGWWLGGSFPLDFSLFENGDKYTEFTPVVPTLSGE